MTLNLPRLQRFYGAAAELHVEVVTAPRSGELESDFMMQTK